MASAPKCRTLWGLGVPMAPWQLWALMSAALAALTAIFAKLGVEQINPDAATRIPQRLCESNALRPGDRGVLVVLLPRAVHRAAPRARRHPMRHQLALSP